MHFKLGPAMREDPLKNIHMFLQRLFKPVPEPCGKRPAHAPKTTPDTFLFDPKCSQKWLQNRSNTVLWEALGTLGRPSSPKAAKMAPQGAQRVPQEAHFGSHCRPKGHANNKNNDKTTTQEQDLRKGAKKCPHWTSMTLKKLVSA